MSMPDAVLLDRWQRRRDADAFTELVQRHAGMVVSCCKRILREQGLAEDVAQECFIALMQSRESIRVSLGAWLHTIAVRRSIDRIKGDARRRKREAVFAEHQGDSVAADTPIDDILACVDESIAELPDDLRDVVVGRFLESRMHTELAKHLGIAESTVRYRVEKGVDQIRQSLRKKGITVGAASLTAALSQAVEAAPAALIVKLGKLAVSGSLAAPGATAWSATAMGKLALGLLGVIVFGVGVWVVELQSWKEPAMTSEVNAKSSPAANGTVPTTSEIDLPSNPPADLGRNYAAASGAAAGSHATGTEPFSIEGRVYDAGTGEGIVGARVQVYPAGGGRMAGRSEPTDEDGHYTIAPIEDGMYSASVEELEQYPDSRGSGRVSVTLKGGAAVSGIDFALTKGIRVAGVVTTPDGQPAPESEVGGLTQFAANPIRVRVPAEARGAFALYIPGVTEKLRIQAQTDSIMSAVVEIAVPDEIGVEGVRLLLDHPKAASISGVVVDGSGAPVEGAQLHLVRKDSAVFTLDNSGTTDAKGNFKISSLPAAEFAVIVTPKGANGFSTSEEYLRVVLAEGEQREGIEIVYGEKGGLAIAGRVVNSKGEPVSGARVQCFADTMENAYTDREGVFQITGLEDKTYTIMVEHLDYSRTHETLQAGTMDATIVLKGGGSLAGRVVRADTGEPLRTYKLAYLIGAAQAFDEMLFSSGRHVDSADGTFSITNDIPCGTLTVAAWAPGFAPVWQLVDVQENQVTNVDLRLTAVAPFEGSVVTESGEPVAGASVYYVSGVSTDRLDRATAAKTDATGLFVLESLPTDAEWVCAYRAGYGIGIARPPGENQIVLPEAAELEGSVIIDGVALSDMAVHARYPDAPWLPYSYSHPDEQGAFNLTGLSPGVLEVSVYPNQAPGMRHTVTQRVTINAGQSLRAALTFERGTATVEGMLRTGGEPAAQAWMSLERRLGDRTDSLQTTAGPDGSFQFEQVWEGALVLKVSRVNPEDPYVPIIEEFEMVVQPGEVLQQDFELSALR
ncbi:MAG: sigma-70 family RNA polymerase sigma factor [Candidatus Hydrogenedentes bacterium]|nr:sigma-70 family RNA polymerase sigma factor [Candidatus Hydrogenedentota bacterium]